MGKIRDRYKRSLDNFFYEKLKEEDKRIKHTRTKMSEIFVMDERSYYDLIKGKSSCSALSLAIFLIYVSSNPVQFLTDLKETFDKISD